MNFKMGEIALRQMLVFKQHTPPRRVTSLQIQQKVLKIGSQREFAPQHMEKKRNTFAQNVKTKHEI